MACGGCAYLLLLLISMVLGLHLHGGPRHGYCLGQPVKRKAVNPMDIDRCSSATGGTLCASLGAQQCIPDDDVPGHDEGDTLMTTEPTLVAHLDTPSANGGPPEPAEQSPVRIS